MMNGSNFCKNFKKLNLKKNSAAETNNAVCSEITFLNLRQLIL